MIRAEDNKERETLDTDDQESYNLGRMGGAVG